MTRFIDGLPNRQVMIKTPPQHVLGPFGRYRLLKQIGQGGMGAVFLAEDPVLERLVAIKIPFVEPNEKSAMLDRFKREAKAVAPLQHSGICPVFDVGEIDGRPYMTMAYIEGVPLSAYIDPERPLPVRSALLMTVKIAAALDYAHKKGVIHRDLKPANIMINERREPVIMDFGLARRAVKPNETRLTNAGAIMGTPAYMPPEQARGETDRIGPAADVYSLGVVLFEMLVGRVPFEGDLFAVLTKLAMDAPPRLHELRPDLDPAVDAICQKSLAKEINDRYPTMADFGRAISAYLRGQSAVLVANSSERSTPMTVMASDPPLPDFLRDLPAAPPLPAARLSAPSWIGHAAQSTETGAPTTEIIQAPKVRSKALLAIGALLAVAAIGGYAFTRSAATTPLPIASPSQATKEDKAPTASIAEPEDIASHWSPGPEENAFPGLIPRPATIAGVHRWQAITRYPRGKTMAFEIEWSPDGRFIAHAGLDGVIRIVDVDSGKLVRALVGHAHNVEALAWHPDGSVLISGSRGEEMIRIWDPASGAELIRRKFAFAAGFMIRWSPGGKQVTSGWGGTTIRVWQWDGKELAAPRDFGGRAGSLNDVEWSPDGRLLATSTNDPHHVVVWDVASKQSVALFQDLPSQVLDVAWRPDSKQLAISGSNYAAIRNLDGSPGSLITTKGNVNVNVAYSPDGEFVRVTPTGQRMNVRTGAVSDDGPVDSKPLFCRSEWNRSNDRLAVCSQVGGLSVWNANDSRWTELFPSTGKSFNALAWSHKLKCFVTGEEQGAIRFWEADGDIASIRNAHSKVACLAWSPDGEFLASGGSGGEIRVWNTSGSRVFAIPLLEGDDAESIAWSPNNKVIVASCRPDRIDQWEAATRRPLGPIQAFGSAYSLSWRPDGSALTAIFTRDSKAIYHMDIGAAAFKRWYADEYQLLTTAWSPASDRLAYGSYDIGGGAIGVLDAQTCEPCFQLLNENDRPHGRPVEALAWRHDGRRFASGHHHGVAAIWDFERKTRQFTLLGHFGNVMGVSWSDDGQRLATAGREGVLRLWDAETGKPVWIGVIVDGQGALVFSPSGKLIRSASGAEKEIVYLVEGFAGAMQLLSHSDFMKLAARSGLP